MQPVTAVQTAQSLSTRDPQPEVLPTCEESGSVPRPEPARTGYLTGAVTPEIIFGPGDFRPTCPCFTPEARHANWPVVELLQRVGQRRNATPGQVALAWLLARKPWIVPIPGTTKLYHQEENLGALEIKLTSDDLKEIEVGFSNIRVQGARATEALLVRSDLGARLGTTSIGGHGISPMHRGAVQ